jgi:hypothetical protein
MKIGKKIISLMQKGGSALMFALLSKSVFANDLLRVLWKKRQKCSIWIKPSKNAVSTVFPINSQAQ